MTEVTQKVTNLAKALAKCLHSLLIGHALQFGLLLVQNTYMVYGKKSVTHLYIHIKASSGTQGTLIWDSCSRRERKEIQIEISTPLTWARLSVD